MVSNHYERILSPRIQTDAGITCMKIETCLNHVDCIDRTWYIFRYGVTYGREILHKKFWYKKIGRKRKKVREKER